MKRNIVTCLVLLGCYCSNTDQKYNSSAMVQKVPPDNIIILLDLSDRLLAENQVSRDKQIMQTIYSYFEKKVHKSLYIDSKDRFMVQIAYQKKTPFDVEKIENDFYINIGEIPVPVRKKEEPDRKTRFLSSLESLYSKAVFSTNKNDYLGADIERYFRDDLANDLKDEGFNNYVVVLTDGYMFIQGKQVEMVKHLIDVQKKFDNLKVVIMEVAPKDIDGEFDRLKNLWVNWLNAMGIKNILFLKKDMLNKNLESLTTFLGNQ